jgi:spore maturation protein CgeB
MRVGVTGPTWPDSLATNVIDALSAMGHVPVPIGSSYSLGGPYTTLAASAIRGALPRLDERVQQRIARCALASECEIVINLESRLMPSVVSQLRSNGVKVALWFTDAMLSMWRQMMLLARYDAVFVKEPHLVNRLRSLLDLPIWYLPEACNPRWHRPLAAPGTERCLVIAGNMYPSRIRLLERLMARGIPLRLYGPGFPRWAGPTPLRDVHTGRLAFEDEKARIFRSAAAVLNNLHPAEIHGVNARLFEAAGCGAAILTEFRPALPELFEIDTEVLAFSDFDELVSQAERLLGDAGLGAKLGDAATLRAHESHTYEKRLAVIVEQLT